MAKRLARQRRNGRLGRPHCEQLEERRLLAGDVVINEIMYHPGSGEPNVEFIELLNRGDQPVDLGGWRFDAGIQFDFPSIAIEANQYLVVTEDGDQFRQRYPDVDNVVSGWSGRLANRGEGITLVDQEGMLVDRVRYADEGDWASHRLLDDSDNGFRGWRWVATHDGEGKSLELRNSNLTNDLGHNWLASSHDGGTPGAPNSAQTLDVAPLIADVQHFPPIPTSSASVYVTAQIVDEMLDSVRATLSYRIDGEQAFTAVPMLRSGNELSATVPPQPDGSVVEFFVSATDASDQTRTVPNFVTDDPTRTAHQLYQVIDAAPSPDQWNVTIQPFTHLIMTEDERLMLADIGDGPQIQAESNAQMNGTFVRTNGNGQDVRYEVGIRNRGGASRIGPPNNYRINFPHDHTFRGQTRLNLNSRFTHAQIIGSAIYRLAGFATAEGRAMQVRVNGEDLAESGGPRMFGSYAELEVINGQFPDDYFPDDRRGNLYRVIEFGSETGDLRYEGDNPDAYRDTYSKRTNEEEDDWSDLIDLTNVLNNSSDEEFLAEVHRVLDVDQWLRFLALDSLLGNLETGLNVGRGDNYWLYRGVQDPRFKLIPHDLDTILDVGRVGQPNRSIFSYTATPGLQRLLTHDDLVPRYYQAFVDLIDEVFNPKTLFPVMDQLLDYISEPELADMKQFVVDRIAGVQAQLPTEFTVGSTLPVVSGYHRTTIPAAELSGTANSLTTRSVLVNSTLADWSPLTRQWIVSAEQQGTKDQLIGANATWRYLDNGSDQGSSWSSPNFNDASWQSGASPLGYGEGDEVTTVGFGGNPFDKHITTYFRHAFDVSQVNDLFDLTLRIERDDGAIVYLNGQEVARTNMPSTGVDFQTLATRFVGPSMEGTFLSFAIDPSLLNVGRNVLAVEVHQSSPIDDDLRLDVRLDAEQGSISGGVPLHPGINRLVVQAFDGPDGSGDLVDTSFVDVWYDGAVVLDEDACASVSQFGELAPPIISPGALSQNTVLAPCGPAYRVTGEVIVPTGITLTVLPGTTIFFEAGAGLRVEGGRLLAEGDRLAPIRFTKAPDATGSWNGVQFQDSETDNRITHAIVEHASTENGLIGLRSSRLEIENSYLDHADFFRIVTVNSSLVVRDSIFTDMFEPGEPPSTDNASEHIKGSGILDGGQFILEGNHFGTTSGHNDSVDFDGAALPGPIPLILNNVFSGSGDDALDLEADAYIEGNAFFNVVRDEFNTSTGDANAISAGDGRTYYVYRNTFHNVDHAVQVKDDAFLRFGNNTVDSVNISPIFFDLEDRSPGKGAVVTSSVFANTPVTFGSADQAQEIRVENSIVTVDALPFGETAFLADPRLADPAQGDFSLLPGSGAAERGPGGQDLGALVPAEPWIVGAPAAETGRQTATLTIHGTGLSAYRYRVNRGLWSNPVDPKEPIRLDNLSDGSYHVDVVGRNFAGIWQADQEASSVSWTVDTGRPWLLISEILASNSTIMFDGTNPDAIELLNDSERPIHLSGMSITDDPSAPDKYVFPMGTSIGAGEYLTLQATDGDDPLQLGFRLDRDGEGVWLFDSSGTVVDAVEFGIQIPDMSISRMGQNREWMLSIPTLSAPNKSVVTGVPQSVRINEWLAAGDQQFRGDYLELHNSDHVPVELSGLYLTDDAVATPHRHPIAPLSFIAGEGFVTFDLNGDPDNGANELEFGLSADGEMIGLIDQHGDAIDQVFMTAQSSDRAQGRTPDGSDSISTLVLGSPGSPNAVVNTEIKQLVDFNSSWTFDQSGNDLGRRWRDPEFDDGGWPEAQAPFGTATDPEIPIVSPLATGLVTHYFRSEFQLEEQLLANADVFELATLVDDGVVVYVNGHEVLRLGLAEGDVRFDTTANRGVGSAAVEGPFLIPADVLQAGNNVVSAEVHQVSRASGDVVFAASLTATRTFTDDVSARAKAILDGLRVTELMYHPNGDEDAEFLELTNTSSVVLDLSGVQISGGIEVTFGDQELLPGEHAVVSPDADVFRRRYGDAPRLLGVYDRKLSDRGEELILTLPAPFDGPFDAVIQQFEYQNQWYRETAGAGFSLEVVSPSAPLHNWNTAEGWRVSQDVGGSPGTSGSPAVTGDFNADGVVNHDDINLINAAIQTQSSDPRFDLNQDLIVDLADQRRLVTEILHTEVGDADLDGRVNFDDFLELAANFGNTSKVWSDGDFNADGRVTFDDFLLLAASFGFTRDAEEA